MTIDSIDAHDGLIAKGILEPIVPAILAVARERQLTGKNSKLLMGMNLEHEPLLFNMQLYPIITLPVVGEQLLQQQLVHAL